MPLTESGLKQPVKASAADMLKIHINPVPDDQKVETAIKHLNEL